MQTGKLTRTRKYSHISEHQIKVPNEEPIFTELQKPFVVNRDRWSHTKAWL